MIESPPLAIAVHGGAGGRDRTVEDLRNSWEQFNGVQAATSFGRELLVAGRPALEVAVRTLTLLEHDPAFNAGIGASFRVKRTRKGKIKRRIELDVGLMDGETGEFAGLAGIKVMPYPSVAAHEVLLHSPHKLFAGKGANRRAREAAEKYGLPILKNTKPLETPYRRGRFEEWLAEQGEQEEKPLGDTVGVLVFDGKKFVAASSTGGPMGVALGRVSDVFIPGAGIWATPYGAACATGNGEDIMHEQVARKAVETLLVEEIEEQFPQPITVLGRLGPNQSGGVMLLDLRGNLSIAKSTRYMPIGLWNSNYPEPFLLPTSGTGLNYDEC